MPRLSSVNAAKYYSQIFSIKHILKVGNYIKTATATLLPILQGLPARYLFSETHTGTGSHAHTHSLSVLSTLGIGTDNIE